MKLNSLTNDLYKQCWGKIHIHLRFIKQSLEHDIQNCQCEIHLGYKLSVCIIRLSEFVKNCYINNIMATSMLTEKDKL